jgi:parallel beta-helix repeat protein
MKQLLFPILFLMSPGLGYSTTYYVANTGNNNYTCREAEIPSKAKLTIREGLGCLMAGDTLIIKGGIYQEFIDDKRIPAGRGSSNAATRILAANGEKVILQPQMGGRAGDAVWLDRSYITIDGFVIDAAKVRRQGIRINRGASHLIIRNMEVKNAKANCISIQTAESMNVRIIASKVHHCGTTNLDHGVYLRGSNHIVANNDIYNNSGHGVHLWNERQRNNDNNIVRHNHIHHNGSRGILIGSGSGNQAYGNTVWNNGTSGIVIGSNAPTNNLVYSNTIYSNGGNCIFVQSGSANSIIDNNVCWQNTRDAVRDDGRASTITGTRVTNDFPDASVRPIGPPAIRK